MQVYRIYYNRLFDTYDKDDCFVQSSFFVDINSSYGLGNYSNLKEGEGGYNTHEKEV